MSYLHDEVHRAMKYFDHFRRKYVLHPGRVRSDSDHDIHYVDFTTLAKLYEVDINECIVLNSGVQEGELPSHLIHLYPLPDGRYVETKRILERLAKKRRLHKKAEKSTLRLIRT